jgi:integrase
MKPEDRFTANGVDITLYRQRAGGNLFAYFTVGKERHRVTTGHKNPRSARERARELVQVAMGASRGVQGTIEAAAQAMLVDRWGDGDNEDRTFRDYRTRLAVFCQHCGELGLKLPRETISAAVQKYIKARIEQEFAPQTIINEQRVISGLFSWLMKTQRVTHWNANPASGKFLTLPPKDPKPRHVATQEEIDTLLAVAKGSFRAVVVLILNGLRPAGAIRAKWADVDLENRTITTKEKRRTRVVKLSPWAVAELEAIERETESVWPRMHRHFFATFQTHCRTHNLPKLTPYALRRAVVARLWSSGYTAEQSARALGHSVKVAENHYRALEAVKDVSESLNWQSPNKLSIKPFHITEGESKSK